MFRTGLVSVTFRALSPERIISLAKKNQLRAIEWGGDIHVPHGDIKRAARVAKLTKEAGLISVCYGSYYRAGTYGEDYRGAFEKVLGTAAALGAPDIRIWAHNKGSAGISRGEYVRIVREVRDICGMAAGRDISVSLECHNDTITDHYRASLQFLDDIGGAASLCWQPNQLYSFDYNLKAARVLLPHIANIHVFHWTRRERLGLCEGIAPWREYAEVFRDAGRTRYFLLEFMPDDSPESLPCEAGALANILRLGEKA